MAAADHIEGTRDSSSEDFDGKTHVEEHEGIYNRKPSVANTVERERQRMNAMLANPLKDLSKARLREMGAQYVKKYNVGDEEDIRAFELGACLAQAPEAYDSLEGLTPEETEVLRKEFTNRWSQPKLMYLVIVLCSTCAAVQGMGTSID